MALRAIRWARAPGVTVTTTLLKAEATPHTAGIQTRSIRYGYLSFIFGERTLPRFNENSKIISVDGNLASGKGALAAKLADKLGMLYMPEATTYYLDKMQGCEPTPWVYNGNCDLELFYKNPKAEDGHSYRLQYWMYTMRLLQYSDALEHLIKTGQGVILERSPYSDHVFVDAMFKAGYIRKQCVEHYDRIKKLSICEFLPPHLVIYIDTPAEEVHKKLKQSDDPLLHNVELSYLKGIEDSYKNTFLPTISETSELLVYSPHQAEDIEKVAEDYEYLEFEKGPWPEQDNVTFHDLRVLCQDKRKVAALPAPVEYLPEITIGAHENYNNYYSWRYKLPGKRYAQGYNEDMGDTMIWWK